MSIRLSASAVNREIQERLDRQDLALSLKDVKTVVETISQIAEDELQSGNDFKLAGVATVRLAYQPKKPKREARNPATGETFMADPVPAKIAVRARPDARMKRSAPSVGSKGGKSIADAYKAKKGL
jgi:nucleoid DNA-binding protein